MALLDNLVIITGNPYQNKWNIVALCYYLINFVAICLTKILEVWSGDLSSGLWNWHLYSPPLDVTFSIPLKYKSYCIAKAHLIEKPVINISKTECHKKLIKEVSQHVWKYVMYVTLYTKLQSVLSKNRISTKTCILQRCKMCWIPHRISGKKILHLNISILDLLTLCENLLFEVMSCISYMHVKHVTEKSFNLLFFCFL